MRRRELKTVIGVGAMLWASVAQAGITPPTPQQIAAAQAAQAAAQQAALVAANNRILYYSKTYDGETGPFTTYDEAVAAGIENVWAWNLWVDPTVEHGSTIFKDAYQQYWFTRPVAGHDRIVNGIKQGQITPTVYPQRPNSVVEALVHHHTGGDIWPDPLGDNLTPYREYVIRPVPGDPYQRGVIWFLPACLATVPDATPSCHRPKIFGGIDNALTIVTKYKYYSDVEGPADLYQVADLGAASPGEGTIWIPIITAAGIAAAAVIGVVFFGVLPAPGGGGSFSNDHCGTISGGGVDGEFVCW